MNLEQLTAGMPELVKITGNAQTEIKTLTADSRAKCESGLFFCIRGGCVDAHDFAPQAVEGGCVALVVERELAMDCPQVVVTDVRAAMTRIASAFNGHPERRHRHEGQDDHDLSVQEHHRECGHALRHHRHDGLHCGQDQTAQPPDHARSDRDV